MMFLSLLTTMALGTTSVCPQTILTAQRAAIVPVGWVAFQSDRQTNLRGVEVFYDNPKTLFALPPEKTVRTAKSERFIYRFPSDTKQVWFDCHYTGTAVILRKRLADSIRRCEVTIDQRTKLVDSIVCR